MKNAVILFSLFILAGFNNRKTDPKQDKPARPDILLIVADDLGYTDMGCFGGDIHTPNIDALAAKGLLFNRFHTSPICAPTRSMILTGNNNHVAGMGCMFPVNGTPRQGKPGYERHLTERVVTVAQLLKDGGYQTFMAGKWHLGGSMPFIPVSQGFEKSFALVGGAANHFGNKAIFENQPTQYLQDSTVVLFPENKFSSDVYTEKMITFIKGAQLGKPFFAYLTYTAPHWPLQVPSEWLDKYKGKYDMGYDSLRVLRFQQQQKKGIIPADAKLPPRLESIKPWNGLTTTEKKIECRKMELYAAMVENLDQHIGQLIQYLKDSKRFDNTLIVFMSDNGAAAEDFYNDDQNGPFLRKNYDNSYENMGKANSFVSYGPQWAQAGAAPFKLFKEYPTEGGTNTPLIICGNGVKRTAGIQQAFINVMDLAPSFLEMAGLSYPETYHNHEIKPMLGQSFYSFIQGKGNTIHNENYVYGLEHYGGCLLIKGNWKITNTSDPFDEPAFALYNLEKDWGETNDLSKSNPKKFRELMDEWEIFKKKTGIIPFSQGEKTHPDAVK
jgi:arylsulfatase A-like enzyme